MRARMNNARYVERIGGRPHVTQPGASGLANAKAVTLAPATPAEN